MFRSVSRSRLAVSPLLVLAAVMHVVAAFEPEHLEKQLFFAFFWAVVLAQAVAGFAVFMRGGPWFAVGAILLNVFLILLFVVTRFVPVPGEERAEPVEAFGVLTKADEIAALPFIVRLARMRPSPDAGAAPREAL